MPDDNIAPAAPTLTDPIMPVSEPAADPVAPPAPTLTPELSTPKDDFNFDFDLKTPESTPPIAVAPVEVKATPPVPTFTPPTPLTTPRPTTPAVLPPKHSSAAPVFIILLLLICVVSIASAAFFWMQNQALISQINTVQQTLDHRETAEITPSPTSTSSATSTATPSAIVTPQSTSVTAFTNITSIIQLAQTNSPTAQLLMITGDHLQDPSQATFKYYFRKSATTKSYIYVQQDSKKTPQLYTQATVTPDNNIPDLAPALVSNKGGVDSDTAWKLIQNNFLPASAKNLTPTNVNAMYLNTIPPNSPNVTTPVNLWQFVIKYASTSDVVVQLDAVTQKLIYSNQPSVTPAP